MAEFANGASIYHAHHGAGTISSQRELCVNGVNLLYYVVDLMSGSQLMLPVNRAGRMRSLINSQAIRDVLSEVPQDLAPDYRVRHSALEEKINSGDQLQIAEILRDLTWRDHNSQLTGSDQRVMEGMRLRLVNILSIQPDMGIKAAAKWLEVTLKEVTLSWSLLNEPVPEVS